jgi:hypothetical protein
LYRNSELSDIYAPNLETLGNNALSSCKFESFIFPKLISADCNSLSNNPIVFFSALQLKNFDEQVLSSCPQLETVLAPLAVTDYVEHGEKIFAYSLKINCLFAPRIGIFECSCDNCP